MDKGILKNYDSKRAVTRLCLAILFFCILIPLQGLAQVIPPLDDAVEVVNPPPALSVADVRLPVLTGIVRDPAAALALGKALFWDMQLGSDKLACASCHFHAGADSRSKNQLSPGLLRVDNPTREGNPDLTFGDANGRTGSGNIAAPNYTLQDVDFPFHRTQNMTDRNSPVVHDTNDVASSQGSFGGFLLADDPDPLVRFPDFCGGEDPTFMVNGVSVRKVEPRHTPTTINAVFNHRNFWDGRANNVFNGVNPFGPNDPNARVVAFDSTAQPALTLEQMLLPNASLASQAVGPPLNFFEMACSGRDFKDLGRGMLPLTALAVQAVHATDSVLGTASGHRALSGMGLSKTYTQLIELAFDPKYWSSRVTFNIANTGAGPVIVADSAGYTQKEHNFSMFFGIAVMLYEATLVSDETPYDAFITANPLLPNTGEGSIIAQANNVTFQPGFGRRELLGLDVFMNKGSCYECHFGPEFTSASVRVRGDFGVVDGEPADPEPIENMRVVDGQPALYDGGFYNIGTRPTNEDLGVGGLDPFGNHLSFSRKFVTTTTGVFLNHRIAVDGAFKTPTIRNVELTGPYMHNGGLVTLRQVVEFYNRAGDRRDLAGGTGCFGVNDTSGFGDAINMGGSQCTNIHPAIFNLNLTEVEIDGLVAFMLALTDNRVKNEEAPFDHPELIVPNGHQGDQQAVQTVVVTPENTAGGVTLVRAKDTFLTLPAVGVGGRVVQGLPSLGTFLNLSPFSSSFFTLSDLPQFIVPQTITPWITPLLLEN